MFLQAHPEQLKKLRTCVWETVIGPVGGEAKDSGEDHVSYEHYKKIEQEYPFRDIDKTHD
jgi:hypothetical protein